MVVSGPPADVALDQEAPVYDEQWTGRVLSAAHRLEDSLGDPARLREVTAALAEFARVERCSMVTGASRLGDQLAGHRYGGRLCLRDQR